MASAEGVRVSGALMGFPPRLFLLLRFRCKITGAWNLSA